MRNTLSIERVLLVLLAATFVIVNKDRIEEKARVRSKQVKEMIQEICSSSSPTSAKSDIESEWDEYEKVWVGSEDPRQPIGRNWVYSAHPTEKFAVCANPAYNDDHPTAELMVWQGPTKNLVSGPIAGITPNGYCWGGLPSGVYRVWYRYPNGPRNGAKYGSKEDRINLSTEALQYLWYAYEGCGKGPNGIDLPPCGCDGMFEVLSDGTIIPRGNTSVRPMSAINADLYKDSEIGRFRKKLFFNSFIRTGGQYLGGSSSDPIIYSPETGIKR